MKANILHLFIFIPTAGTGTITNDIDLFLFEFTNVGQIVVCSLVPLANY